MPSDIKKYGHLANGMLRGQKADIYEGGHRVPLIITWPTQIAKGKQNHTPVVLNDIMATVASIVDVDISHAQGLDSVDFSPLLFSDDDSRSVREPIIHHSFHGMFAIRKGHWKLIEGTGGGGFMRSQSKSDDPQMQLYNLAKDPQEQTNLFSQQPKIAAELLAQLNAIRNSHCGRLELDTY